MQKVSRALYVIGLNGTGVLNYRNAAQSGEGWFLRNYLVSLEEPPCVLDVGANEGNYSASIRRERPDARLIAVEPHPETFKRLRARAQNLNVEVVNVALAERVGHIDLYDYADSQGSTHASVFREALTELHGAACVRHRVLAEPLDQLAARLDITTINLLKLDVEGNELAVLKGAKQLLAAGQIHAIQFEFNGHNVLSRVFLRDFAALLQGHVLYRLLPAGLVKLNPNDPTFCEIFAYQNIVALRPDCDWQKELSR